MNLELQAKKLFRYSYHPLLKCADYIIVKIFLANRVCVCVCVRARACAHVCNLLLRGLYPRLE